MNDKKQWITQILLVGSNAALFALFWYRFYNYQVFTYYSRPGCILVNIIFWAAFLNLAFFHGAFKIKQFNRGRLIFANILTLGTADIMIYIGGCMFKGGYMDVKPGFVMAFLQGICALAIVLWATHPKIEQNEEE